MKTRTIATAAIFTAFVAAVTMAFAVYIPATKGYFNTGEIMVYVVAILMGPYVGAFAGGVGSAISDAILAPQYAPGTLVVKGLEGLGAVVAVLISYLGVYYLSGPQELYIGFSSGPTTTIGPQFSASFTVPWEVWPVIGGATFLAIAYAGFALDAKVGWTILSILVGGSEMVTGYFLFESIGLQLGYVTAGIEVPINAGQVLVGLIVAVPLVRSYRRMVRRLPRGVVGPNT